MESVPSPARLTRTDYSASVPEKHDWNYLLFFLHSEDSQCLVHALRLDKAKATAEIANMVE